MSFDYKGAVLALETRGINMENLNKNDLLELKEAIILALEETNE